MATKTFIDSWSFDETLKVLLHSPSSSTLYKLLTAIRKDVEWPQHKENIIKLHRSGCLKQVVTSLHSSHLHIVSVALSILGNSCMDSKSANEIIINNNGLSELNQILKRYPSEDGVVGRIFRIIGNMCQHTLADLILDIKPQLVSFIVKFIKDYAEESDESVFTEATVVMGVRALRQLLNGRTFIHMVKKCGLLKGIGTLLIKCSIRWTADKKDQHVLDTIIKFLLHYSRYRYYPGIIEMRNTPKGDSLVHLSKLLPLAPKKIVKIIMNFIRISQLKSDLPIPEICDGFVKLLKEYPLAQDFNDEYIEYIRCLCYLLEHPSNRSSERCRESIPQLIRVLNDFKNPTEKILESCILIVGTLDKCSFHDPLIKEQLGCNIIDVLVKKMEWLIGSSKTLICKHKLQKKKKRKHSQDSEDLFIPKKKLGLTYPELWEPRSPMTSDEEIDFIIANRSTSPSSGSESELVTSPWSSPGSSPMSQIHQDLSDSEDYSPVCSDAEDQAEPSNIPKEDEHAKMDIEKLSDDENDSLEDTTKFSVFSLKYRLLNQILTLLKTYSVIQPPPKELCSEALVMTLLKCSNYFDSNSITTEVSVAVICRILQVHDYLIPLMQTDVVAATYSFTSRTPHGSVCVKCIQIENIGHKVLGKFYDLAQCGRGKGDIANRLILGSHDVKKQLVLSIPYIVRAKQALNYLMLRSGGLEILLQLLQDLQFQEKSIRVLCILSTKTLGISNPQRWAGSHREKMFINDYRVSDECKNVVTFVLDDNSCLSADRDFLCEKSCFFNSLLNGSFRESNEDFVKLHHTGYIALKSLIRLLHSDFDKTEPKDVQLDTSTLLEVIVLCDRYLLEDLCGFLTECVQQFSLTSINVPIIYKWSLESKTNILRVESIAYALVAELEDSERLRMFSDLFNLGYSDEIVSDIQELLSRYLTLRGLY
ncbi:hypothetical protein HHI36_019467 [Cryptolaemus montrouzieri]|uniref:BTB domain-containing protein n=1 Tax=Cryptolaemus montrouzieri TaxID=559131 RepID=A0ABD2P390_9CUCU